MNQSDNSLQLQVDQFCTDIIDGVRAWISQLPKNDAAVQNRLKEAACIQQEHGNITILGGRMSLTPHLQRALTHCSGFGPLNRSR